MCFLRAPAQVGYWQYIGHSDDICKRPMMYIEQEKANWIHTLVTVKGLELPKTNLQVLYAGFARMNGSLTKNRI